MPLPISLRGARCLAPVVAQEPAAEGELRNVQIEQPSNSTRQRASGTFSFGETVRSFFTSLMPTSQAGVHWPRLTLPTVRDVAALAWPVAAATPYGAWLRHSRGIFSTLSFFRARGATLEQESAVNDQALGAELAVGEAGSVSNESREDVLDGSEGVVDLIMEFYGDRAPPERPFLAGETPHISALGIYNQGAISNHALEDVNTQIICDTDGAGAFPIALSWVDGQGQYHERRAECREGSVLEAPRNAEPLALESPAADLTGAVYVSVGENRVEPVGSSFFNTVQQQEQLLRLVNQLFHDQRWDSLLAVVNNILAQVDSNMAPALVTHLNEYRAQAEYHMSQRSLNALPDSLATVVSGILAGVGVFFLCEWYQGYRNGRRGWPLLTRPFTDVALGVGSYLPRRERREPLPSPDEERGAVGGVGVGVDNFDWCDDRLFETVSNGEDK